MEKKSSEIAKELRLILIIIYLVACVTAAVFELGLVKKGLVSNVSTIYLLEVIGVLISLGLIPLSLKGFKKAVERIAEKDVEKSVSFYKTIALLRLIAFFIVIEFDVLLYYIIDDSIGLYCAVIGLICSLFCFPSVGQVQSELGVEEE